MGILNKVASHAISEDKKIELAFGLMDTIHANILSIAEEVSKSEDREYMERALKQFVLFDERTCRAIEYLKHNLIKPLKGEEGYAGND